MKDFTENLWNFGGMGAFLALLVAFITIDLTGIYQAAEGNHTILWIEIGICSFFLCLGIYKTREDILTQLKKLRAKAAKLIKSGESNVS